MEINVQLTAKDIQKYGRDVKGFGKFGKISKWIRLFILSFLGFFGVMSIGMAVVYQLPIEVWGSTVLILSLILIAFIISTQAQNYQLKLEFKNNRTLSAMTRFTISRLEIQVLSRYGANRIRWKEVVDVIETASCILINFKPSQQLMIPLRCFENSQQLEAFRELVKSVGVASTLKNKPLKKSHVDIFSEEMIQVDQKKNWEPLVEVSLVHTKKEVLRHATFKILKHVGFWLLMLIGLFLLMKGISASSANLQTKFLLSITGTIFILLPFTVVLYALKPFHKGVWGKVPFLYQFSTAGFTILQEGLKEEIKWTACSGVSQSKQFLIVTTSLYQSHVLPKRIFTYEQLEMVNDILKSESFL